MHLLLLCGSFFAMEYQLSSDLPLVLFFLLLLQFIMLTYIFMLAWLGVTAFTSLPVYMYFNLWTICRNATVVDGANLCLDLRQYGMWMKSTKYKAKCHKRKHHFALLLCIWTVSLQICFWNQFQNCFWNNCYVSLSILLPTSQGSILEMHCISRPDKIESTLSIFPEYWEFSLEILFTCSFWNCWNLSKMLN